MREVVVSKLVREKIEELKTYLTQDFQLSWDAASARIQRMEDYVESFSNAVDYPKCRFKRWRALGYRCAVFEKSWIFAYEVFDDGIIIRDMSNTALLAE